MKKKVQYSLLLLITVLIVLYVKNQYTSCLLTNATYGMPALIHEGAIDNLYLGSSMFRQALDMSSFSKSASDSYYVLAYNGNQPIYEYYQLKNLLDHHVVIKNLYVDLYVYSAWAEPKISDEKILLELNARDKYIYWQLSRTQDPIADMKSLWQTFLTSNNELLLTWPINNYLISKQFYCGSSLNQAESALRVNLETSNEPDIEFEMNKIQKEYLQKLIVLARSHNINLVFVETPKYHIIEESDSYRHAMNTYCQLLIQQQVPYVVSESLVGHLSDSEYVYYYSFNHNNADFFADIYHLSYTGKKLFTPILERLKYT